MQDFIGSILLKTENLLQENEEILGKSITSIARSFLIIIGGRYGINTTNGEWYQILFAILYFFSPIDLCPDFIPLIGWFDDMFIFYIASKKLYKLIKFSTQIIRINDQKKNKKNDNYTNLKNDDETECGICYGENGKKCAILKPCGHLFCEYDTKQLIHRNMLCPYCRAKIAGYQIKN